MMRICASSLAITLSIAFAASACKEDAKAPAGSAPPSAAPASAAPAPTQAAPAPPAKVGASLTCASIVPQDVADEHMPGAALVEDKIAPAGAGTSANCVYAKGGEVTIVAVVCVPWDDGTFKRTMEAAKGQLKEVKDLPGVGRMAYQGTMASMSMIQVWDDDTPCHATITGGTDAVGLAKAVVGSLNPTTTK
jgi:hypothetical protein